MKKKVLLFLLLCVLGGCSSLGKGMVEGLIEAQSKQKEDISCTIMSAGFSGLQRAKEDTIKVLLVHGVGPHTAGYSMAFILNLTKRMGMNGLDTQYKEIQLRNDKNEPVGHLRVYRFFNEETKQSVVFYEQTWSEITAPIKADLSYDTTKEYAQNRSPINTRMKFYINETIPDSTIYFGPEGEKMLASSIQSFCWLSNFNYEDLPPKADKYCLATPEAAAQSLAKNNIVFITNSLSSRITLDSLQVVAEKIREMPKTPEVQKAVSELQNKEITVFMLANQIPLLQMGKVRPKHVGMIADYCQKNGSQYQHRLFKKLNVVAISDPNDLLSYGLEPAAADKYFDSSLCPQVTNVSLTTSFPMSVGVGAFTNPLTAHTNYQTDPYVLDLIVEGLEENHVSPAIEDNCRWIKLNN